MVLFTTCIFIMYHADAYISSTYLHKREVYQNDHFSNHVIILIQSVYYTSFYANFLTGYADVTRSSIQEPYSQYEFS